MKYMCSWQNVESGFLKNSKKNQEKYKMYRLIRYSIERRTLNRKYIKLI